MKRFFLVVLIFFTSSCGFKVVDYSKLTNFRIVNIQTKGEKRINYKLKNKLLINNKDINAKSIDLRLKTTKQKIIKEKNLRNEITKYSLKIIVNVEALHDVEKIFFNIIKSGDYAVNDKYSKTLNNEKKLIELLTDDIADEIYEELINNLNDL